MYCGLSTSQMKFSSYISDPSHQYHLTVRKWKENNTENFMHG